MTIQYIKDEEGKDQYVVIPYSDYFRMRLALLEYDDLRLYSGADQPLSAERGVIPYEK